MIQIVVDASTIGNAILGELPQMAIDQIEGILAESELVEPCHWPIEIAGFVLKASRRQRIARDERERMRSGVAALIRSASVEGISNAMSAFDLAVQHNISLYDASYLELAVRMNLPLFTSDQPLAKAALAAKVELIELK